jgi:exodeoxyribonuclease VII large subunit
MTPLSITDLTAHIKDLLENDPTLDDAWVEGEVSNCRAYGSGHWYFSLKDEGASISCVMWKFQALRQQFLPEDGGRFVMHGRVSVYADRGNYQLVVDQIEPAGQGLLHQRFEQLKAKLAGEGLFDAERKRPLPAYPLKLGIVTSRQAAALQDVLKVLARRWPVAEVLLAPTAVQGDAAPPGIVAALEAVGRAGVDLVILCRGGGSLEDLWAFNDEAVARAIAACPVPVISGVGHETDFTIADFVADLRAPTPSAAAELATPDADELRMAVDAARMRLERSAEARVMRAGERLEGLQRRMERAAPGRGLRESRQKTAELAARLRRSMQGELRLRRAELGARIESLEALSPLAVLARGYAQVTDMRDGRTLRSVAEAAPGSGILVRLADGRFEAVVAGQAPLFESQAPKTSN